MNGDAGVGTRRALAWAGAALLLAAGWLLLGPQQLGGPMTVVSTHGTSMEPTFSASDLVVVVRASDYVVGDVVAYRSQELQTVVLHRIVDRDDDAYVTQGDNNDWLDGDRPTGDDMIGTARLRIPQLGRLLAVAPPLRAAMVGGLALAALTVGTDRRRRRTRRPPPDTSSSRLLARARPRRRHPRGAAPAAPAGDRFAWVGWPAPTGLVAAAVAVVSLLVLLAAFGRPATGPDDVEAVHHGAFGYHGNAPAGVVYPDGRVATGGTVFLQVVDEVEVDFTYRLDGPIDPVRVDGRLWLELADGTGWSSRSALTDLDTTDGGELELTAVLDLDAIQSTLVAVGDAIGAGRSGATVGVVAEIEATGDVAATPATDTFVAELSFQLDQHRLAPRTEADGDTDDIVVSRPFTVTVPDAAPAMIELGPLAAEVALLRWLGAGLLAAALLALVVAAWGAHRRRGWDEPARLQARYGRRLLPVTAFELPAGYGLVEVPDVETLVGLADRVDRPILHHHDADGHTFVVEGDATVYRVHLPRDVIDPTAAPSDPVEP